ncbi:COG3837 Uncharacterized conserved protein, contains double-stranded beta-helix domain [Rhabdaerophilaceae bacterium]
MPKLDLASIPEDTRTGYPPEFAKAIAGRSYRRLTGASGLTQFGVNIVTLQPGAASSQRHWHEKEDEFAYMLTGELILIEDDGETIVRPGDCIAWPAGVENGHHLVNRSAMPASFLVVGTRSDTDRAHYPDIDMLFDAAAQGDRFTRKDGTPF